MRVFRPETTGLAPLWEPAAWLGAPVRRGAIRLKGSHLTASYELDHGGGWHHLRLPLEASRLDDDTAQTFRSPLDPELRLPSEAHLPPGLRLGPLLQHRLGSRLVWRGTLEMSPGSNRAVAARLSRRAAIGAVLFAPRGGRVRLPRTLQSWATSGDRRGHWTIVDWAAGVPLHETLSAPSAVSRAQVPARLEAVGRALAEFHAGAALDPAGAAAARARDAAGELAAIGLLHRAAERVFTPAALTPLAAAVARLAADAAPLPTPAAASQGLVHGDLHDKQILLDGDVVTLIDLDGAAPGPAELDIGNLEAHLILRALQQGRSAASARAQIAALAAGYAGSGRTTHTALRAWYRRATLLRLALLYLFRLSPPELPEALLHAATRIAVTTAGARGASA